MFTADVLTTAAEAVTTAGAADAQTTAQTSMYTLHTVVVITASYTVTQKIRLLANLLAGD